jgi:hypothetical protein
MGGGPARLHAQDGDLLLNDETYRLLERIDIQGRSAVPVPLEFKPLGREQVAEILQETDASGMDTRARAWLERARVHTDDDYATDYSRGYLKYFYRNRRDLLHYASSPVSVYLNPQLYVSLGGDAASGTPGGASTTTTTYRNTRGASLRGNLFKKVGFYADIQDNQARYPSFIGQNITATNTIWGEQWYKLFGSGGYDFLSGRGYLTYSPFKNLRLKFGRDRAFVGNGYQSLLLSDNATDYLLFNIALRFNKFEYICHYTQFIDYIVNKPDAYGDYPRKWGAFHQLLYRPVPQVSIALFESTIYASQNPNGKRGFELQYLNPLMFYRSAEQYIGSPDNALLGMNVRVNFLKRFQTYAQLAIDDYNIGEALGDKPGWWGNKIGWQAGLKYIDVLGIETLDLQLEANRVRPYTYGHYNASAAYTHYNQYLAHGWGANLQDVRLVAFYQPLPGLMVEASYTRTWKGLDTKPTDNFGGNPLITNNTKNNGQPDPSYNNVVGQGSPLNLNAFHARISWQFWKLNAFIEAEGWLRSDSQLNSTAVAVNLRLGLPYKPARF